MHDVGRRWSRIDDERGDFGQAVNTMADRLVKLREEVKRQERQVIFGRVAAGLMHDLSHPIQSQVGTGTAFTLPFPACDDRSAHAAAS